MYAEHAAGRKPGKGREMNPDAFAKYLQTRYEDQIEWYSTKASHCKRRYQEFQWGVIVLSASLPVLITALPSSLKWLTVIISIILAIGTTALKTFKFQENWVNYRTVSEMLKKEKHFYDADVGDFARTKDKEALFVKRVEALISQENTQWGDDNRRKDEENDQQRSAQ
jgi:hypothetical protein